MFDIDHLFLNRRDFDFNQSIIYFDVKVKRGSKCVEASFSYCITCKSTRSNLTRLIRCLETPGPVMLEGSPGVGKTSIVEALAQLTGNQVVRINLSEQTDLSELFGADLPVASEENRSEQRFEWRDGPFLLGLRRGSWIILDEINLASQSVLEGLNSCFDHRAELFIAELGKTFQLDSSRTKIFACQNPFAQGGGRKGLPKSFLNRFAKVYVNPMSHFDLVEILSNSYGSQEIFYKMVEFNDRLSREVCVNRDWGTQGSPWEFNLRDVFRWCELMRQRGDWSRPGDFVYLIYASRFRTANDRRKVFDCFESVFNEKAYEQHAPILRFAETHLQIGQSFLNYPEDVSSVQVSRDQKFSFTEPALRYLESIGKCVEMGWMLVLVGHASAGKTSLIRMLAALLGQPLVEFSVNSATDTSDLLGGFAKVENIQKDLESLTSRVQALLLDSVKTFIGQASTAKGKHSQIESLVSNYLQFSTESKKINESKALLELIGHCLETLQQINRQQNVKFYLLLIEIQSN